MIDCETLGYVQNGLLFVACVALGFSLNGMHHAKKRYRKIRETQDAVGKRLAFIQEVIDKSGAAHQWVGLHTWRDLDPASQEMFRLAITNVLAEMQATPPPTRH